MRRDIEKALIEWRNASTHLPIMLRGARQVGKSYLVENFGRTYFKECVTLNFEQIPRFKKCFETFEPQKIINLIEFELGVNIVAGGTLLFLDEIQECPNAIMALRYFKEQMPDLHVIAAGSLLEFALEAEDFRMPVGRVQFLYLKPLSFKEFLVAKGHEKLRTLIENFQWGDSIPNIAHEKLLELVKEYMILGGMPAVIENYLTTRNMRSAQAMQYSLMSTYENDFSKYAKRSSIENLKLLFRKIPELVTHQFKYTHITQDIQSRDLKAALHKLIQANIVYPVYASAATGLPLNALINPKKVKLLFLDTGLVNCVSQLGAEILMSEDFLAINKGAIAEQFIGQELLAYQDALLTPEVYFWARDQKNARAEVDYVINVGSKIIPIEVKSGHSGRLKSLKLFIEEYKSSCGVRLSLLPPEKKDSIIHLPLYMAGEIGRLV